jgi:hypothetical protein
MRLDIVLPVRVDVPGRARELERVTRGVLPSLIQAGYPAIVSKFNIICPAADVAEITAALSAFPQFQFQLTTDESLLSDMGYDEESFAEVPGWFKQQLLKLSAVRNSEARLALVLDADVVALRPCPAEVLDGGAIPYQKMGVKTFRGWFATSALALGMDIESFTDGELGNAMGVTPEFLSPATVRGLIEQLRKVSGRQEWGRFLMSHTKDYVDTWTEYSLYWIWYLRAPSRDVEYKYDNIYCFIQSTDNLDNDIATCNTFFAVLQSTKLTVDDCASAYSLFDTGG